MLASQQNSQIILVSHCRNMSWSEDTNNLVNLTTPIQIWIYLWEMIPQSFIWLDCENEYQWPRQREVLYLSLDLCCPLGYYQVAGCYFTYPGTNMWRRTDTTVVCSIRMWIHVSLEDADRIVVSNSINMSSSKDTINLVDTTPHILIWICCWELILHSFIECGCEYQYQWIMQR